MRRRIIIGLNSNMKDFSRFRHRFPTCLIRYKRLNHSNILYIHFFSMCFFGINFFHFKLSCSYISYKIALYNHWRFKSVYSIFRPKQDIWFPQTLKNVVLPETWRRPGAFARSAIRISWCWCPLVIRSLCWTSTVPGSCGGTREIQQN